MFGALLVSGGVAAQDMVGPSWLAVLPALPRLIVYAGGELSMFLAPVLALFTVISWCEARWRSPVRERSPRRTGVFVVLTALAAIPAVAYWLMVGRHEAAHSFGAGYVSTTTLQPRIAALEPPPGTDWPKDTGYLALPQLATGGDGVIRVRASTSRVYVKLCEAGQRDCPGLRHALIERGKQFDFRSVASGSYEVRYLPIDRPRTGGRSKPIVIPDYYTDPAVVTVADSPTIGSTRESISGIDAKDF